MTLLQSYPTLDPDRWWDSTYTPPSTSGTLYGTPTGSPTYDPGIVSVPDSSQQQAPKFPDSSGTTPWSAPNMPQVVDEGYNFFPNTTQQQQSTTTNRDGLYSFDMTGYDASKYLPVKTSSGLEAS